MVPECTAYSEGKNTKTRTQTHGAPRRAVSISAVWTDPYLTSENPYLSTPRIPLIWASHMARRANRRGSSFCGIARGGRRIKMCIGSEKCTF